MPPACRTARETLTPSPPGAPSRAPDAEATARTAKEFKIIYQKVPGSSAGTYTMDHSAGTYVFDPQGRLRLYVANGQGADVFAHDLRELLRAG